MESNKFNISAFTLKGSVRDSNQDSILVNGQLLIDGEVHLTGENECICFVADGVGGNNAGDFASYYVLNRIKTGQESLINETYLFLKTINKKLIVESKDNPQLNGCCTTLTGLIIQNDFFKIVHAGDSQIWLLRNDMFFKTTTDQVLDETIFNSPITSYFGGSENYLKFDSDISIHESLIDDLFLICSDGLFKSLNQKIVKSILKADKDLETKAKKILENCLHAGAEDNISVILIQQTK